MFQLLYKYLLINRQVGIPGIGLFQLEQIPARMDFASQVLHAPIPTIRFTQKTVGADKDFFTYVTDQMNVQEWETIRRFHDFSYKLKTDLNAQSSAELPGMGRLMKNKLGEISFEPTRELQDYFPSHDIKSVYREDAPPVEINEDSLSTHPVEETVVEEEPKTKDRWWIAALVLAVLAVGAIVYYYITHRSIA